MAFYAQIQAEADLPNAAFLRAAAGMDDVCAAPAMAVAVSGGPDSMALLRLAADIAAEQGTRVYALTVDHGLRADAAAEAAWVAAQVAGWPGVEHHVLTRPAPAADAARVMESAREDRYALMAEWCRARGIRHLLTAHHRDDQAETFLFRLAKGSGLDGLAGMRGVSDYDDALTLVRPLLAVGKAELVAVCDARGVPYVRDPSNVNMKFARSRLRAAMDILAAEGLTAKRLAVTALRFGRARAALEHYADRSFAAAVISRDEREIVLNLAVLEGEPTETRRRVIAKSIEILESARGYSPRMEALEELTERLFSDPDFTRASLRHCLIARRRDGTISIARTG
jgi:tRNA(Ile)-lysidine synthase